MPRALVAILLATVVASGQTPRRKVLIIGIDGCRPDAIADAFWTLHTQPRSAWTFDVMIRPDAEKW